MYNSSYSTIALGTSIAFQSGFLAYAPRAEGRIAGASASADPELCRISALMSLRTCDIEADSIGQSASAQ